MKRFDEFLNEAFDWEDFDDTDLHGPMWSSNCRELISEFVDIVNKEMKKGTYPDVERKQALFALKQLFDNEIQEALKTLN